MQQGKQQQQRAKDEVFEIGGRIMNEVSSEIAQNMHEMSHEDREKSYLDLHGVSAVIEETPTLIEQSLELMSNEITGILDKEAYLLAESMDPDYVHSRDFRLMFLRGEGFNALLAAGKFVKHFKVKQYLFGTPKLVKNITQDDMGEDDIAALHCGYMQWLPIRDPAGRTIAVCFPGKKVKKIPIKSRMRVSFYLRMVKMEDVEAQKKGFLIVVSASDSEGVFDLDVSKWKESVDATVKLGECLPGRTFGTHVCLENLTTLSGYVFSSVIQFCVNAFKHSMKVRIRIHKGSTREDIIPSLQAFGIPTDVLPRSPSDNSVHNDVLMRRKRFEEEEQKRMRMLCIPGPFDVMLGRGRKIYSHPGNVNFLALVEDSKTQYDNCIGRKEKRMISEMIVQTIKKKGSFLLKKENFGWVEVDDEAARNKVSHALRDFGKNEKKRTTSVSREGNKRSRIEPEMEVS